MVSEITQRLICAIVVGALLLSTASEVGARRLLFSFDGTGNDPDDAVEQPGDTAEPYDEHGMVKDQSISNVLKLHLLAGGTLDNSNQPDPEQFAFYYMGVGNRGLTRIDEKLSAALAIREPRVMLKEAIQDLERNYRTGDQLYVFGFSRGAAIARQFAQRLADDGIESNGRRVDPKIRLLGVWDTVAAFGGPEMDKTRPPSSSELDEKDGKIAPNVELAYHLVSIDDPRIAFRPTLMGAEERVHEIWFPGVHSDVGGGYEQDGLSDIALQFMIDKARVEEVTFMEVSNLSPELGNIGPDLVAVQPNTKGELHLRKLVDEKDRILWLEKFKDILALRRIYVAVGDEPTDLLPVIHHSVLDRRDDPDSGYNPENLKDLNGRYQVLTNDGSLRNPW